MDTTPRQTEMDEQQKAALAAIESVGLEGLWANGKGGGFWVSGGHGYMSVEDCLKFHPEPEPTPEPEPKREKRFLFHSLGGRFNPLGIVLVRYGEKVTAGLALDGLQYIGHGATVREAVMDLAAHVDTFQPDLNPAQSMFPLTARRGSLPEFAKYLNLWQQIKNKGEVFVDRPTGRTEKIVAVLPNGSVVMENTFGKEGTAGVIGS